MDKIEVTQDDKDAAASLMSDVGLFSNVLTAKAVQAFARHRLATRTDATPVAVEMVAELQLSAFLAGRGSIRTKANGNTHESSPGPTMDDYRRMARFALAEGWVDATPVAEPRTIYVQWADNGNIRKWAWSEFDLAEKLNVETAPVSDTPFAWAYHYTRKHPGQTKPGAMDIKRDRHNGPISAGWTETPLYTHPPATDVAALVEAAKETNAALERDGDPAFTHLILANKAALAPFTKGQNDE